MAIPYLSGMDLSSVRSDRVRLLERIKEKRVAMREEYRTSTI